MSIPDRAPQWVAVIFYAGMAILCQQHEAPEVNAIGYGCYVGLIVIGKLLVDDTPR